MKNIQIFPIKSRYLKFKIFITENILLVLFDIDFYCDIFTNIHATLLVFFVSYYSYYNSNCSVLW